jgi:hypothetical protein
MEQQVTGTVEQRVQAKLNTSSHENSCPRDSGAAALFQHPLQMLTISRGNARFVLVALARLYIEPLGR